MSPNAHLAPLDRGGGTSTRLKRDASTDTATIDGVARIGRLVTSAALILFLAFSSLAQVPVTDVSIPRSVDLMINRHTTRPAEGHRPW